MKYCSNCGLQLADTDAICKTCGAAQANVHLPKSSGDTPGVVITLCVITIIGSVFGMFRGMFYDVIASVADNTDYWRGYAYSAVNIGTLAGAIFMLNKKRIGFIIYVIFQISYILLTIYTTSVYMEAPGSTESAAAINSFTIFIASIFLIPSIILLILNIALIRKYMR